MTLQYQSRFFNNKTRGMWVCSCNGQREQLGVWHKNRILQGRSFYETRGNKVITCELWKQSNQTWCCMLYFIIELWWKYDIWDFVKWIGILSLPFIETHWHQCHECLQSNNSCSLYMFWPSGLKHFIASWLCREVAGVSHALSQ